LGLSFFFTFCCSYYYSDVLFYFFAYPALKIFTLNVFIATKVSEIFLSCLEISFFVALYLFIVKFLIHVYYFLIPGLYKFEQKYLLKLLSFFIFLLILSFIVTYIFIIPIVWNFFFTFENALGVVNFNLKMNEYLHSIYNLFFISLICFQLPFILKLGLDSKFLSLDILINKRHFFIISFFILAGIISPPDIYSQILLAFICILFFELTIFISIFSSYRNKFYY
jgi:sec-independent protein translocase protein TatC